MNEGCERSVGERRGEGRWVPLARDADGVVCARCSPRISAGGCVLDVGLRRPAGGPAACAAAQGSQGRRARRQAHRRCAAAARDRRGFYWGHVGLRLLYGDEARRGLGRRRGRKDRRGHWANGVGCQRYRHASVAHLHVTACGGPDGRNHPGRAAHHQLAAVRPHLLLSALLVQVAAAGTGGQGFPAAVLSDAVRGRLHRPSRVDAAGIQS